MASPFKVFRKNQKVWMVALTVLAMVSFLFLGNFGSSQRGGGPHEDPEVFSWKYGKVTANDLRTRMLLQQKVQQFFAETGKAIDRPVAQINQFIGNQFPTTDNGVITAMLLNKKAEDLGIVVSDDMVRNFIRGWTEGKVGRQQLADIVRGLANNAGGISQAQLFDAIRFNLAATYALQTFQPNLVRSQQYMNQTMAWFHGDTPAERWDYFERMNRKATTEIMPVVVKDFVDKVPDPTATELQTFYDEYKNAYPVPGSRTPGFREPYKAQIEYVKVDNAKLIEEILPTITDQEVQEYYDKYKDVHFRKLKLPSLPDAPEKDDTKAGDSAAKDAASDGKSEKADGKSSATPDAAKDSKDAAKAPETKADAKADSKASSTKAGEKSNSSKSGSKSSKASDGKKSSALPATSLNGELLALADDPIYLAQKAAATDAPAADGKSTDAKAEDTKKADPAATDAKASTETPADAAAKAADTTRVVEYEPLDKVAGQAKNQIAQKKADEKVLKAFVAIQTQMSRYRSALDAQRAAEIAGKTNVKQAQPPDLEALAKEYGLQYRKSGLITMQDAYDSLDIGKSRRPVVPGMRTAPPPFVQVAFMTDANSQPFTKTFAFEESDDNENNHYLWWKVADEAATTPKLDAIKAEVVQAWKQVKARKLASDQADAYVAQVNKSKQTLKEAFGATPGKEIITPGPFSWLTRPAEQPFAQPRMSEVTGLDHAGYEFMKNVFKLKPGEAGVAPNDPLTVYYVVQMQSEEPPVDTLRQNFMTAMADPMSTMTYAVIGAMEHGSDMQQWFNELESQYGVKMAANYKPVNSREYD